MSEPSDLAQHLHLAFPSPSGCTGVSATIGAMGACDSHVFTPPATASVSGASTDDEQQMAQTPSSGPSSPCTLEMPTARHQRLEATLHMDPLIHDYLRETRLERWCAYRGVPSLPRLNYGLWHPMASWDPVTRELNVHWHLLSLFCCFRNAVELNALQKQLQSFGGRDITRNNGAFPRLTVRNLPQWYWDFQRALNACLMSPSESKLCSF